MTPEAILQAITLGIAGWTLRELINQSKQLARLEQAQKDMPCQNDNIRQCESYPKK